LTLPVSLRLPLQMLPQPDETTCGPTCLHAVYRYWGKDALLAEIIERTHKLEHGGTFAIFLACDALRQGFQATIYTYNLTVFDPTWFVSGVDIAERLERQRERKTDPRLQRVTEGYLAFLRLGGRLRLADLSRPLIRGLLRRKLPIITGLSSTYLYRAMREYGPDDTPDDIRGLPSGHFVVIAGYDRKRRSVLVADPYWRHPYSPSHEYWVSIDRVIGAVLLGIVTHDANLLVIYPPRSAPKAAP
jgi:AcrR family transcriptional regulator